MSRYSHKGLKFIFVFMSAICCGFLTMLLSPIFIPDDAGLAGGPTVLMFGIVGFAMGLLLPLYFINKISTLALKRLTLFVMLMALIGVVWLIIKAR